jgi:Suppressor of fused protein (SUFU)
MTPTQIAYEQQYNLLAAEHRTNGDPTVFVFDTYLRWKGVPLNGARPIEIPEHLSRHFSVLEFAGTTDFRVFGSLGASFMPIPGSEVSFNDPRGVRYEYLLHAPEHYTDEISELLMLVAEFPFKHKVEVQPGYVLQIGEPVVPGSNMEYLYFTYPYLDDARLYEGNPWGQIEQGKVIIQVLWAFPIYLTEYQFLRKHGVDQFEELINQRHQKRYDAYDFERLPYV